MRKKIFTGMCLLALMTTLLSFLFGWSVTYREFYTRMQQEVKNELGFLVAGMEVDSKHYLDLLRLDQTVSRVTWIDAHGTVLYDSVASPQGMKNHSDRPEFQQAIESGFGKSTRLSDTIGKQTFYYAQKLSDGTVLRVASTTASVYAAAANCLPWMVLVGAGVLIVSLLMANLLTKKMITPINTLDLEHPEANEVYEELTPLLARIAKQHELISQQMSLLKAKQREFSAITENMREGLIVLDEHLAVLSMNESAKQVFEVQGDEVYGKNILHVNRSDAVQHVVHTAQGGAPLETLLLLHGQYYQLIANPVLRHEKVTGIVLLVMNVTEKYQAEQMRKEFSANVSHELKTPLTSISGYAELLKSGMVAQEDVAEFSARIYHEASRLITLVQDIMELSRLDEQQVSFQFKEFSLLSICQTVKSRLAVKAEQAGIDVTVSGDPILMEGNQQLVEELIYNLCENAIKYNREDGTVSLRVLQKDHSVVLEVADTGIGIPKEHQQRVFERFYRVDKSHSKETGGTGLGLSIVKHIAEQHNARIELHSEEEKGTSIRVFFAKETHSV